MSLKRLTQEVMGLFPLGNECNCSRPGVLVEVNLISIPANSINKTG